MSGETRMLRILLAEDRDRDVLVTREALNEAMVPHILTTVSDGQEVLDYLYRQGAHADPLRSPRPDVILLDLNLPRVDGRDVLRTVKTDRALCHIPIVILSTAHHQAEVLQAYRHGANAYIEKPISYDRFVEVIGHFGNFFTRCAALPREELI
ncbi:MAG: response regulator [Myxococcota bacterium]